MNRFMVYKGVSILALSVVLAACGQASADEPSVSPKPSDRPAPAQPSEHPSREPVKPVATPKPSLPAEEPAEEPAEQPSQEPAPIATPKPMILVGHPAPMIGRVTNDGVAVRILPDLQSEIVSGDDAGGVVVDEVRLRRGDDVIVLVGPVYADGFSWYEVMAGDNGPADWFRGWVAGEFLEHLRDAAVLNPVLSLDGQGFDASATGFVPGYAPLTINHAATPMPGADSCTFSMSLVGTSAQLVELVREQTVTDAHVGQIFPGNFDGLYVSVEGSVTLEVVSDCSFAAAVTIPQG